MGNVIRKYIRYLRKWIWEGLFLILLCAAYGSFHGATIEAADENYYLDAVPTIEERGLDVPIMTGYCGLAARQNQWRNFHKAFKYAAAGGSLYLIMVFCGTFAYEIVLKGQKTKNHLHFLE
jgi:hypothetical protein